MFSTRRVICPLNPIQRALFGLDLVNITGHWGGCGRFAMIIDSAFNFIICCSKFLGANHRKLVKASVVEALRGKNDDESMEHSERFF